MSLNRIDIMGRLVRDPELRYTAQGAPVTSFTLAVDRDYQSGGSERQTDFIDVVAWKATAEFVSKYFSKGSMAVVTGRLQIRDWEDKNGNKRKAVEIVVDNANFCGSKSETGTAQRNDGYAAAQPAPSYSNADEGDFKEIPEDDLPF